MACISEIKVLDCTVRDGGLVNNFEVNDDFVQAVYIACAQAGLDYMEIGYKASKKIFAPSEYGKWKFCNQDDLKEIVKNDDYKIKLSVMADTERTDYHEDTLSKSQSVIDMIRVATYSHQISTAMDIVKDAHDKGYDTAINLMAVSLLSEIEFDEALEKLVTSEAQIIYLVDSYGALYPKTVKNLTEKDLSYAQDSGKKVGIHTPTTIQEIFFVLECTDSVKVAKGALGNGRDFKTNTY